MCRTVCVLASWKGPVINREEGGKGGVKSNARTISSKDFVINDLQFEDVDYKIEKNK